MRFILNFLRRLFGKKPSQAIHSDGEGERLDESFDDKEIVLPKSTEIQNEVESKRAVELGQKGERISNFAALPIATYGKQLRNLYIPMSNGHHTEVDTLIVSVSGLYVLETKYYKGWIYGDEDWKNWTVSYSKEKNTRCTIQLSKTLRMFGLWGKSFRK